MTKTQDFIVTLEDLSTRSPGNIETLFAQAPLSMAFLNPMTSFTVKMPMDMPRSTKPWSSSLIFAAWICLLMGNL